MSARLLFEDTEGAEPYDNAYLALLDQHKATLEDLLCPQAQARLATPRRSWTTRARNLTKPPHNSETARADLQAGWDEYHAQIAEAETQIRSVVDRLTAAIAQADESAAQLNTAGQQIAQARAEVNAQQQELNSQQQNLNQAQQEIDAQRAALENANAAFLQQINSLQEQIAAAEEAGEDTEALVAQLAGVQGENYDVFMETVYGPGWAQLDAKQAELTTASSQLASAQDRLNSAIAQINQKQAEYDAGAATLAEGRAEIARQQQTMRAAQIDEQQQTYDDAAATFAEEQKEALAEIDEKTAELDEAQADLDALEAPTYTVADRRDFPGYEQFGDNSTRIDVLSRVFPVFLFAIAALVSLTTMTRMVEEERITNGTLSALGYTPTAIRRKYLVYGVGASLLGAIVGLILGHTLLPTRHLQRLRRPFHLPEPGTIVLPAPVTARHPHRGRMYRRSRCYRRYPRVARDACLSVTPQATDSGHPHPARTGGMAVEANVVHP
ncbi:hypothetical protein quinque_007551 [Culex quinquefasciatus]